MWKMVKLGDVCEVFSDGDWIETKHQSEEGIRLVQTGNIKSGFFADRLDKARHISEDTFSVLNCTEIFEGDILVSRLPEPVGRACIIPSLNGRAITAVDCTIIRVRQEHVTSEYLNYYMQSPSYFSAVQEKVTGATRQRISRKNLNEVQIQFPPLVEQQRIVAKLDAAFGKIDTAIQIAVSKKTEIESLKGSILDDRLISLLEKQKIVCLSDVCERVSVGHVGITSKHYCENGVPFIRTQNVSKTGFNDSELKYITKEFHESLKKSKIQGGDVLLSRVVIDEMRTAVVPDEYGDANCANVILIRPNASLNSQYLSLLIKSRKSQKYFMGVKKGAAQQVVNTGILKKWQIPLPPIEAQKDFVEKIEQIFLHLDNLHAKAQAGIAELAKLRTAILADKLRANEAA
jgi:type I restriction enzyme S subunit